jgi:hypothetical protein
MHVCFICYVLFVCISGYWFFDCSLYNIYIFDDHWFAYIPSGEYKEKKHEGDLYYIENKTYGGCMVRVFSVFDLTSTS